MKKLFVLFACVAMFSACSSNTTETATTNTTEVSDSTMTDMVSCEDSTMMVDACTTTVEATATTK